MWNPRKKPREYNVRSSRVKDEGKKKTEPEKQERIPKLKR